MNITHRADREDAEFNFILTQPHSPPHPPLPRETDMVRTRSTYLASATGILGGGIGAQPQYEEGEDLADSSGVDFSRAEGSSEHDAPPATGNGHPISWPVNRPSSPGVWSPRVDEVLRARETQVAAEYMAYSPAAASIPREYWPGGERSLRGIGTRAFALGATFGTCAIAMAHLELIEHSRLWRPFAFASMLSVFHFLEFWVYASYNVPGTSTDSFLLSSNGTSLHFCPDSQAVPTD